MWPLGSMSAECSPTASACFCVSSTDASSASSSVEEVGRPLGSRPGPLPWAASSGRAAPEEPSGFDSATRGDLSRDLFRDSIYLLSSSPDPRWANPNVFCYVCMCVAAGGHDCVWSCLWAAGASPSRMLQCSMAAGSPSDSTWEAVCTLLRVGSLETGPRVRHGPPGVDRYSMCVQGGVSCGG